MGLGFLDSSFLSIYGRWAAKTHSSFLHHPSTGKF
jgi:hypothetical protein